MTFAKSPSRSQDGQVWPKGGVSPDEAIGAAQRLLFQLHPIAAIRRVQVIVGQVRKLHLSGVVFLLFNISESRSTAVLFELGSGNVFPLPLTCSAGDLKALHEDYRRELKKAEEIKEAAQDPADVMCTALDGLLDAYARFLEPVLEILVEVPCKLHLKIFPRLHMNAVPFHALRIRGKRLMEYGHIQVSYGQTLGLFLQAHRRQARHGKVPLRMVLSENLPQSYKGVLDTLKLVYGEKYFYGMHLTRGEFLTLAADELAGGTAASTPRPSDLP
jgi:hypothetical protein